MTTDPVRILIADHDTRHLDALDAMLRPLDCAPVRARSSDEALRATLAHDFAVVILDVGMPGIGGIELATLIKQRPQSRAAPILFLTAHQLEDDEVRRRSGGLLEQAGQG